MEITFNISSTMPQNIGHSTYGFGRENMGSLLFTPMCINHFWIQKSPPKLPTFYCSDVLHYLLPQNIIDLDHVNSPTI